MAASETVPTTDYRAGVTALIDRDRALVRLLQRVEELERRVQQLERERQ